MTFREAVTSVLSKYATFTGRAGRSEFWWFYLFGMIAQIVAIVLDILLFGVELSFAPIRNLVAFALMAPFCAVMVRRLQDTGRSFWWVFLLLIPIIGWLVFVYYLAQKGEQRTNKYGEPWSVPGSESNALGFSVRLESEREKEEAFSDDKSQLKLWKVAFSIAIVAACTAPFITGTWKANPQSNFSVPLTDDERKLRKSDVEGTNNCRLWEDKWNESMKEVTGDFNYKAFSYSNLFEECLHSLEELKIGYRFGRKFSEWKYLVFNLLSIFAAFISVFALATLIPLLMKRYWVWLRN